MYELTDLIKLVDQLVSIYDPTPILINDGLPLRWEAPVFIHDYDFSENYLDLDKKYECQHADYLISVRSAIEINTDEFGKFEYFDGVYMTETHTWCGKLNTNKNYPSYLLINLKFNGLAELKQFLVQNYS
jgi:hypothetical protein